MRSIRFVHIPPVKPEGSRLMSSGASNPLEKSGLLLIYMKAISTARKRTILLLRIFFGLFIRDSLPYYIQLLPQIPMKALSFK